MLGINEVLHEGDDAEAHLVLPAALEVREEERPELGAMLTEELLRLGETEGVADRPGVDDPHPAREVGEVVGEVIHREHTEDEALQGTCLHEVLLSEALSAFSFRKVSRPAPTTYDTPSECT